MRARTDSCVARSSSSSRALNLAIARSWESLSKSRRTGSSETVCLYQSSPYERSKTSQSADVGNAPISTASMRGPRFAVTASCRAACQRHQGLRLSRVQPSRQRVAASRHAPTSMCCQGRGSRGERSAAAARAEVVASSSWEGKPPMADSTSLEVPDGSAAIAAQDSRRLSLLSPLGLESCAETARMESIHSIDRSISAVSVRSFSHELPRTSRSIWLLSRSLAAPTCMVARRSMSALASTIFVGCFGSAVALNCLSHDRRRKNLGKNHCLSAESSSDSSVCGSRSSAARAYRCVKRERFRPHALYLGASVSNMVPLVCPVGRDDCRSSDRGR